MGCLAQGELKIGPGVPKVHRGGPFFLGAGTLSVKNHRFFLVYSNLIFYNCWNLAATCNFVELLGRRGRLTDENFEKLILLKAASSSS